VPHPRRPRRDPHLADEASAQAAAGHGRTLLLAGEAGIGKTRLVYSIIRRVRANGFRYAGGDLVPQDADVPLAALRDLFRSMRLDESMADLGDALMARCDEAAASGDAYSRTLVLDLVDRIRHGIDRPTIIKFEDLQWADDITLEAVAELPGSARSYLSSSSAHTAATRRRPGPRSVTGDRAC
jgi:predicted ATPase